MKLYSKTEFDKFLSSIALAYCTSVETNKLIRTLSLSPSKWPSGNPREIITHFINLETEKNFHVAYYSTQEKFKDFVLLKQNCFEELPDDTTEIQNILDFNLKIYWSKEIANKILKSPEKIDEYILALNNVGADSDAIVEYTVDGFLSETISKNIADAREGKNKVVIPAFKLFSEEIGGFNGSRVSGISASSGFGKTKLAINIADAARYKMPVYYFNMEMSPEDFEAQFIQMSSNITYNNYKTAKYAESQGDQERILKYKDTFLNTFKITFTDGRSLNIDQICSKILVKMQGGGLVICDYDQKIIAGQGEEWFTMVRSIERLEQVAKKTNSHVIVLFQADDEGLAKSSKRSIQPLSSFTHFTKNDKEYYLKNIKNRFGKTGFEICLDYFPETTKIIEKSIKPFKDIASESINPLMSRGRR